MQYLHQKLPNNYSWILYENFIEFITLKNSARGTAIDLVFQSLDSMLLEPDPQYFDNYFPSCEIFSGDITCKK